MLADQRQEGELKQTSSERYVKAINEINQIKSALKVLDPINANVIKQEIGKLKETYTDLSPQVISLIETMVEQVAKLEKAAKDATAVREIINQNILAAEEAEKLREANRLQQEHADRITETAYLQTKYDGIEKDFRKALNSDSIISNKIISGEKLNEEEKARFTRIHRTPAEKESFEKEDKLKAEGWGLHYKLKDNHEKIVEYSQDRINTHNENVAGNKYKTQEHASEANVANSYHQANFEKSKAALEKLKINDEVRKTERKGLVEGIKEFGPDLCKRKVMDHFSNHREHYRKNPNHESTKEFNKVLQSVGLSMDSIVQQQTQRKDVTKHNPCSSEKKYSSEIQEQVSKIKQASLNLINCVTKKLEPSTLTEKQMASKTKDTEKKVSSVEELTQANRLKVKIAQMAKKNSGSGRSM